VVLVLHLQLVATVALVEVLGQKQLGLAELASLDRALTEKQVMATAQLVVVVVELARLVEPTATVMVATEYLAQSLEAPS
jgi:hypothetical protein